MYPQLLTGQKATPEHASNMLDKLFNTSDPKRDPVILLVDEVRACTTRKRTIGSVLFCICYRQCQHCRNISHDTARNIVRDVLPTPTLNCRTQLNAQEIWETISCDSGA